MVPAVPVVIIPAAAAVIAATAAAERPTYPQKGEAPRERCLFRFRGIRAIEGMRTAQAVFRHRLTGGRELRKRVRP